MVIEQIVGIDQEQTQSAQPARNSTAYAKCMNMVKKKQQHIYFIHILDRYSANGVCPFKMNHFGARKKQVKYTPLGTIYTVEIHIDDRMPFSTMSHGPKKQ